MKIQVGNLATDVAEAELRMLFECFGQVAAVEMRRIPGNAVVDMPDKSAGREAIEGLDSQEVKGRNLSVSELLKRPPGNRPAGGKRPRGRRRRR